MSDIFSRTCLLLGKAAMEKLKNSRVAVFGIGGVGGYVVEALVRSGIGAIDLVDNDEVSVTNRNRQIIALESTVGRSKVEVSAARIHDINPECRVTSHQTFFLPETEDQFDFTLYDYVVDAIDTVTGKLSIIQKARASGTPVISSMGTGNKLHPEMFEIADIYKTSVCPLAKVMRRECKKRGIDHLKVVYSKEEPLNVLVDQSGETGAETSRHIPGSIAFVPAAAGMIIAGEVIRDLAGL